MILFLPGVFLLLEPYFVLQVDGAMQRIQVDAKRYNEVYKDRMKLGDCPIRYITFPNDTQQLIKCPYKYTGDEYFIPLAQSSFDVKRLNTIEDMTSRMGGGLTVGAGVAGLISAEVKGSVMVNTETSKRQLTLSSVYRLERGVMTLRNAKPAGPLPAYNPTELYLSEIVLGGTEVLLVKLEFESEKTKTEVELTVTVKILWISLSAKLTYISENLKQSAAVEVVRYSTWRGTNTTRFDGIDSLQRAIEVVKKYEEEIKEGPAELLNMRLDDSKLHLEYHFSPWRRAAEEEKFNEALTIAHLKTLLKQIEELWKVYQKASSYVNSYMLSLVYAKNSSAIPQNKIQELTDYQKTTKKKLDDLFLAYKSYFFMSPEDRERIPDIYGRSKAPFYYIRRLNSILG